MGVGRPSPNQVQSREPALDFTPGGSVATIAAGLEAVVEASSDRSA